MDWEIIHIAETNSTNRWITNHTEGLFPCAVIADYQTAGRGCGSNSWESMMAPLHGAQHVCSRTFSIICVFLSTRGRCPWPCSLPSQPDNRRGRLRRVWEYPQGRTCGGTLRNESVHGGHHQNRRGRDITRSVRPHSRHQSGAKGGSP